MGKKSAFKTLTLNELACDVGSSERMVSRLIERGELTVSMEGDRYVVSREDVKSLRRKLAAGRADMLNAFNNRDEVRYRAIREMEEEMSGYHHPTTNRIQLGC